MRRSLAALIAAELLLTGTAEPRPQLFDAPAAPASYHFVDARSLYIPMSDGVRIAIDVLTPSPLAAEKRIPTLMKISRLGRAPGDGSIAEEDRFWVERGYARVLVDERGTGASFGTSRFSADTVSDLRTIVDWIAVQPWSNGRVGAIGVSVEGTAAEFLASSGHPAVRAVAPWFSDYDYYTDVVRPGGVYDEWVMRNFGAITAQTDRGESAKPVGADPALLAAAVAEHRNNVDLYEATRRAEFSDDPLPRIGRSLVDVSASRAATGVPMLVYASWFDAGTAQGALQRFRDRTNGQQVYIGAWSHGADFDANPFAARATPVHPTREQQRLEALRYFDAHLRYGGQTAKRVLHYYTVGENAWHSTTRWPPAGLSTRTFHLQRGRLVRSRRWSSFPVAFGVIATGDANRWRTQFGGGDVVYDETLASSMADADSFTSDPLASSLEITGQPQLRVKLTTTHDDPSLLAYLFAVDVDGRARYLTEGSLRLIHRRRAPHEPTLHTYRRADAAPIPAGTSFEADVVFLPISAVIPRGSRLRLLLAGGDESTFATAGSWNARLHASSRLHLPSRPRPDLETTKELQ